MRRSTKQIHIGAVPIGGTAPISVQSMTNTVTSDIEATINQVLKLEEAGCDIIRMAINSREDAEAIPEIKKEIHIPIIADIQFDYRLAIYAVENGVDGLRINPGNIGDRDKVEQVVKACKDHKIPIRIGVNTGSIKQEYIDKYHGVNEDSIYYSAMDQIEMLESMDFFDIKVALKSSSVPLTIAAYRKFSRESNYPLHIGVTEAGYGQAGIIKSTVGIGTLLAEGIGDTLRVSLTADPVEEVKVGREILKSLGLLKDGIEIVSCPTCARTKINLFKLVEEAEARLNKLNANLKIAIMGCVVNGPGEARDADYGITGGNGQGIIFKGEEILATVREDELLDRLVEIIEGDQNVQP